MPLYVYATFANQVTGQLATGYTAEVGGTPAPAPSSTGFGIISSAGHLYHTGTAYFYWPNAIPATANYVISCDLIPLTAISGNDYGVTGRKTDASHYDEFVYFNNSTTVEIGEVIGSTTNKGSATYTLANPNTYLTIATLNGTTLTYQGWLLNGASSSQVWNLNTSSATLSSIGIPTTFSIGTCADGTGVHFGNFQVTDFASAFMVLRAGTAGYVLTTGGAQTVTAIGVGTNWLVSPPAISVSGAGSPAISGVTAALANLLTFTLTPGSAPTGIYTFTDATTGAIGYLWIDTPRLVISPPTIFPGSAININVINKEYVDWTVSAPSLGSSGPSGVAAALSGATVEAGGNALALLTPFGCATSGTVTVTDATTGGSGTIAMAANPPALPAATMSVPSTNGTIINGYAGSNGGLWTPTGYNPGTFVSQSAATTGLPENTWWNPGLSIADAVYYGGGGALDMSFTIAVYQLSSNANSIAFFVRHQGGANTYLSGSWLYNTGSPTLALSSVQNGTSSTLSTLTSGVPTFSSPTTPLYFTISVQGTAVTISVATTLGGSPAASLTATTATVYLPGRCGIRYAPSVQDSPTSGYRFGASSYISGPRCVTTLPHGTAPLAAYANVLNPSIATCGPYGLVSVFECRTNGADTSPSDVGLYVWPPGSESGVPSFNILYNDGTGATSLIPSYTGTPQQAFNVVICWAPGVGSGPHGRICVIVTRFPYGGNSDDAALGNVPTAATAYLYYTFADNGPLGSWAAPIDITPQVKSASWGTINSGPGNGMINLPGNAGFIFTAWYSTASGFPDEATIGVGLFYCSDYTSAFTHASTIVPVGTGNETQISILADNSFLAILRNWGGDVAFWYAAPASPIPPVTWTEFTPASVPIAVPACTLSAILYDNYLVVVCPNSTAGGGTLSRVSGTLIYSGNDGNTWSNPANPAANFPGGTELSTATGAFGYSAAAVGADGNIYVIVNTGAGAGGYQTYISLYQVSPAWVQFASGGVASASAAMYMGG